LRRCLVLAFGVCFVFALGEFGTFHLAGVRTLGTEINDLYILTNSDSYAARAAWPLAGMAVVMGVLLWRRARDWTVNVQAGPIEIRSSRRCWAVLTVLLVFSLGAPLALLVGHVRDLGPLQQFWKLHSDELFGSLVTAALGAAIALLMAGGALGLERFGRAGRTLSAFMQITILMAMFLPGSLVAVGLLKMLGEVSLTADLRQGWYVVSAGLAARFAGVALILLRFGRDTHRKHL
jgi:ABC-type Fe3+ transport system permease subunit